MRKLLALLFVALFSSLSFSLANAREEAFASALGLGFGGGTSQIGFAPGYNHQFFSWLQAGGSLSYQKLSYGETNVSTWTLQAGPTFNTGPMENAIFISFGFALRDGNGQVAAGEDDPSGSGFYFYGGKRFAFGNFALRPSIGFQMTGGTSILLNLLSVSYFL